MPAVPGGGPDQLRVTLAAFALACSVGAAGPAWYSYAPASS